MTLTPFEWVLITAGVACLVAVIAWLIIDKIRRMERDHKVEVTAREKGDSSLMNALGEITKSLREISDANIREHGTFAHADDMSRSHRRIYEGIEDIRNTVVRIEAKMVTQEQCHERHAAIAGG